MHSPLNVKNVLLVCVLKLLYILTHSMYCNWNSLYSHCEFPVTMIFKWLKYVIKRNSYQTVNYDGYMNFSTIDRKVHYERSYEFSFLYQVSSFISRLEHFFSELRNKLLHLYVSVIMEFGFSGSKNWKCKWGVTNKFQQQSSGSLWDINRGIES